MYENGKLTSRDLAPIPGGQLAIEAAAAWNAPGGPADAGLLPEGPEGSYRDYQAQVVLYKLYQEGKGNLAAIPGYSNHGLGLCVDLKKPWMRAWIDEHGARFGWCKTEAFSEWWHVNYDGTKHFPTFVVLHRGDHGPRVMHYTRRLTYIRRPGHASFLNHPSRRFDGGVEDAVVNFQHTFRLHRSGKIDAPTAAKIDAVFLHQYHERHSGLVLPRGSHR